jgi:hypothetical protein
MKGHLLGLLISFRSVDKYGCHGQLLFLIGRFLKLLNKMNRNLVGRSSIKIANFVTIH